MRYIITARVWDDKMMERFGLKACLTKKLSDAEVIDLIMKFGRCQIVRYDLGDDIETRVLNFQND